MVEFSQIIPEHPLVLRGIQIKLARIALGWDQRRLADEARLAVTTVQRAERSDRPRLTVANLFALQSTLERAGIRFIDDDEEPGLRIRLRVLRQ